MKKIGLPKIRAPKIGGPKIKVPKLSTPKIRGPQVRMPPFLNNLYRDMRDRRLLVPAVALLVALIAVPMLLKSSSSSVPPPPAPAPGASQASAAEPAVVTQQIGITDYRKRLERFKSKNPFLQHFTAVPKSSKLKTSSSLSTTSSTTTTLTPTSTGSSTSTSSTVSPSSSTSAPVSGSVTPTPTTSTTSGNSGSSHHHHHQQSKPKPVTELVQRRIDVKVGSQDAMVEKTSVKQLAFLPNSTKPLVAYLGANEAGTKAFFLVSSDVASASGDGVCLTTTPVCQYFTLKPGEVETFDYTPDPGTPYKLRLKSINDVVTKKSGG